jgi:hypothetical protein
MHESQRPTPRLVLGETGQLCSQRIDLGAELTNAPQRGIHILTTHRRQLGTRERVAPCLRQRRPNGGQPGRTAGRGCAAARPAAHPSARSTAGPGPASPPRVLAGSTTPATGQQHGAASAAQMRSAAHALCNSTVTGDNTWVTLHGRQRARHGRSGSLSPSICRARAYPQPPSTPSRHVGQPIPPTANRNSTRTTSASTVTIGASKHYSAAPRKPAKASAGCRALISSSSH